MTLGVNRNVRMPRPKGARPPFGLLRDATIHPAHATLRLPTHTVSSPEGAGMAQLGRFLYCPINLTIALTKPRKAKEQRASAQFAGFLLVNGWSIPDRDHRPRTASLCRDAANDVDADPITGEERAPAEQAAGQQCALGNDLGHRPRQRHAQDQEAD